LIVLGAPLGASRSTGAATKIDNKDVSAHTDTKDQKISNKKR
jgi:hypothetical protein